MSLFHLEALAISATLFLQRYRTNCQGDRAPSCRHSSAAVIWAFQSRYSLPFCKLYFLYRSFLVFRWIASGSFLFILYCKQSHSWSHRRSKGLKQPLRTWFVLFSEILFYIRSVRISNLKIPKYRGSGSAVVSNEWTKGLLEDLEGQVRIDNFEFWDSDFTVRYDVRWLRLCPEKTGFRSGGCIICLHLHALISCSRFVQLRILFWILLTFISTVQQFQGSRCSVLWRQPFPVRFRVRMALSSAFLTSVCSHLRDQADDIFCKLPPPTPSIQPRSYGSSSSVTRTAWKSLKENWFFSLFCRVLLLLLLPGLWQAWRFTIMQTILAFLVVR